MRAHICFEFKSNNDKGQASQAESQYFVPLQSIVLNDSSYLSWRAYVK